MRDWDSERDRDKDINRPTDRQTDREREGGREREREMPEAEKSFLVTISMYLSLSLYIL